VHLARGTGGSAIDVSSDVQLFFDGDASVTLAAGEAVYSDSVEFSLAEQSQVAITVRFETVPKTITGHPGSRTSSFIIQGNAVVQQSLSNATRTEHWYYISRLEVGAPETARALVTLGDSLTDGRGSTTNGNDRWPDVLSRRLRENRSTREVAVVNAGIGGNAVLSGGLGPSALMRFDRDVLEQASVQWVIVLEGVNDIGNATSACMGDELIAAYREMIDKAHARGVLVYGAAILPFGGSTHDDEMREKLRQQVNEWIRNSGEFDAVIDLEPIVSDPRQPRELLPRYDSGDKLHLSASGYRAMAHAVDLSLFER
jgi:lysophospholipase L1-like esterase